MNTSTAPTKEQAKAATIAAQVSEGYAWPGGYPLFAVTDDGRCLCPTCCKDNADIIASSYKGDGWRVVGQDVNWEDPQLYCDHCSERIESAYAEQD